MNTQNPKDTVTEPSSIGKKTFTGKVVSAKSQKTITVLIETQRKDATYQKFVVTIIESRPISKKKFFVLKEIVRKAIKVGVSE
jgi:ribosomal protein S17